ncbi:MAG: hypothetical protein AAFN70_11100, partial [Planctomycetota bacterium]
MDCLIVHHIGSTPQHSQISRPESDEDRVPPGAWNMAVDAALQMRVDAANQSGERLAVLRVYSWPEPTLSLGYFQSAADAGVFLQDQSGVEIVRRSTGGGAILHHHDLTYSLCYPMDGRSDPVVQRLYRTGHDAMRDALDELGCAVTRHVESGMKPLLEGAPFLCFQRRTDDDLVCDGYKLVGSAQRRSKFAVLQHGSVLLAASPHADSLPGIQQLSNVVVSPQLLAEAFAESLAAGMNVDWQRGSL